MCVVGAGAAGLVTVKALREHGFDVDCFEREADLGGVWDEGREPSPIYSTVRMISSRPLAEYPDFPMPDSYPDYPDHRQVLAYLRRYADHFGLRRFIDCGTEVLRIQPPGRAADRWRVTVRGAGGGAERTLRYAAVVVANGHLHDPNEVRYPGQETFTGEVVHSLAYRRPEQLADRRVLVIGGGNSGSDIAVDASRAARRVWLSTRRGYWHSPKYVFGKPADQANEPLVRYRIPMAVRRPLFRLVSRSLVGPLPRLGLRRPDHRPFAVRPIVNSLLLEQLGRGAITPVPDVARFEEDRVVFTDGTVADPDLVVMATGYRARFGFLPDTVLGGDPERPGLHLNLLNPSYPTFAVIGLVHPDSGQFAVLHWQAELVGRLLRARAARPDEQPAFLERIRRDQARWRSRAGATGSGSRSVDVDRHRYLSELERTARLLPTGPSPDRPARWRVDRPVDWLRPVAPARREVVRREPAADPTGPPLLVVHDGRSDAGALVDRAAERGYRAAAIGLRAARGTSLREWVHDVVQEAAALPERAVLIGCGTGALAVAHALARYPAAAAVLLAPAGLPGCRGRLGPAAGRPRIAVRALAGRPPRPPARELPVLVAAADRQAPPGGLTPGGLGRLAGRYAGQVRWWPGSTGEPTGAALDLVLDWLAACGPDRALLDEPRR